MKRLIFAAIAYIFALNSFAQFQLIQDINNTTQSQGSFPRQFATIGTTTYFVANDGIHGFELWKTDGTSVGTVLVKDINPGPAGSNPYALTVVGSTLFFAAENNDYGVELWKSNGTSSGTVMVKDIYAGTTSSNPNYLINLNGVLIFAAENSTYGTELWKSDGTSSGTVLIKDIQAGSIGSSPIDLIAGTNEIYFTAYTSTNGRELWKSDGTTSGTQMIKNIFPTNLGSDPYPSNLFYKNGFLYFSADDNISGAELWKSDGTLAGTNLLFDINPGSNSSNPREFVSLVDTIIFVADNDILGTELWRTEGTAVSTINIKDINAGSFSSNPANLVFYNNNIFFQATEGINGVELWKTNGTSSGTELVKNINLGGQGSFPSMLTISNGTLYFSAFKQGFGFELWTSDGTSDGTILIKDIWTGVTSSNIEKITPVSSGVIFSADNGYDGQEPWISNGTALGTNILKNIFSTPNASNPSNFINYKGKMYFAATSSQYGRELWMSDGTINAVQLVKDIFPGQGSSNPSYLTIYNDTLYFAANDSLHGIELWKTDGTSDGTMMVKDIYPNFNSSEVAWLTVFNNLLYFAANDGVNGNELWVSDGTEDGTRLFNDIVTGVGSSFPEYLTVSNGFLFFSAENDDFGKELWSTDGDSTRTSLLKDINVGTIGSYPKNFVDFNNTLFFTANNGVNGVELWKSNGTIAGTTLVKDIQLGAASSNPQNLIVFNDRLYFSANDGMNGEELWWHNPSTATTNLFKDINAGEPSSCPQNLTVFNNLLLFTADDGTTGQEFWFSSGLACATRLNVEFIPGIFDGSPKNLHVFNDKIFLSLNDNTLGDELYQFLPNQDIFIPSLNRLNYCAGDSLFAYFYTTNNFAVDNIFTLQLSNASGSFTSPTILGNLTGSTQGEMRVKIPTNIVDGNTYKIRIIASNPAITGTQFCENIQIKGVPQISAIDDQIINEDESTELIGFTVNDLVTPANNIVVSAWVSDENLVNSTNIAFGGSGNNRNVMITPNENMYGTTNIKIIATDADACVNYQEFTLDVLSVNDVPMQLISLADQQATYYYNFSYRLRENSFADIDGDSLRYAAKLVDGSNLPSWMLFNDTLQEFSGIPPVIDTLTIVLYVDDGNSGIITDTFNVQIDKAPLFATAMNASRKYGANNPNFEISYDGFMNNESINDIDELPTAYSLADNASDCGLYPINVVGGNDDHYQIIGIDGTLEITKASLTFVIVDTSRKYAEANPVFRTYYTGFLNNDNASMIDIIPEIFTVADETSVMGDYPVIAYNGEDNNYEIQYQYGVLTVEPILPVISTVDVPYTNYDEADITCNLVHHGGDELSVSGVCWGNNPNPTISNNHTSSNNPIGLFTEHLTGIGEGIFYVRAYAQNVVGVSYGEELSFTIIGTNELAKENEIHINLFPNPAENYIMLQPNFIANNKNYSVAIFDNAGKMVYFKQCNGNYPLINVSAFKPGIYLLKFEYNNTCTSKTFVIKRE